VLVGLIGGGLILAGSSTRARLHLASPPRHAAAGDRGEYRRHLVAEQSIPGAQAFLRTAQEGAHER
jgi:hypothetical protein